MEELLSSLSREGGYEAEHHAQVILEDPIRERAVQKDSKEADVEEEDAEEGAEEEDAEEGDTEEKDVRKHLQVVLESPTARSIQISEDDTADEGNINHKIFARWCKGRSLRSLVGLFILL